MSGREDSQFFRGISVHWRDGISGKNKQFGHELIERVSRRFWFVEK